MRRAVALLGVLAVISPAMAQTTAPLSPPGAADSGRSAPKPSPDPGVTAGSPAVIVPGNPDPGMSVSPQQAGATPVIPPGASAK